MNRFPPLTWFRHWCEWWAEKPKYQWTIGDNPLVAMIAGKDDEGKPKSYGTIKLCRGARLLERIICVGVGAAALCGGPAAIPFVGPLLGYIGITGTSIPWLGMAGGHFTGGVAETLFNLKANSMVMGFVGQGVAKSFSYLTAMYDQILNGPDDAREAAKYAKQYKKMQKQANKQLANLPGGVTPSNGNNTVQMKAQPSVIDKMIALGHAFNGRAGQIPAPQQQMMNTVIWGDNNNGAMTGANQPGNGQQYEQPFQVPTEDTVRIASSGREGAWQHDHHIGSAPPQQQHHHTPEPPAYKPPGCDNN
jgi:hypothetical protein